MVSWGGVGKIVKRLVEANHISQMVVLGNRNLRYRWASHVTVAGEYVTDIAALDLTIRPLRDNDVWHVLQKSTNFRHACKKRIVLKLRREVGLSNMASRKDTIPAYHKSILNMAIEKKKRRPKEIASTTPSSPPKKCATCQRHQGHSVECDEVCPKWKRWRFCTNNNSNIPKLLT